MASFFCPPTVLPTLKEWDDSLNALTRTLGRTEEESKFVHTFAKLGPFLKDDCRALPKNVSQEYWDAITNYDFSIGPRIDARQPRESTIGFLKKHDGVIKCEDLTSVKFGNIAFYALLADLQSHPLNDHYRRTTAGLRTCAAKVVSESNLASHSAEATSSLITMIEACEG